MGAALLAEEGLRRTAVGPHGCLHAKLPHACDDPRSRRLPAPPDHEGLKDSAWVSPARWNLHQRLVLQRSQVALAQAPARCDDALKPLHLAHAERAAQLSEGSSTAMATTAFGLLVAIPALAAHAVADANARELLGNIERVATRLILSLKAARQS